MSECPRLNGGKASDWLRPNLRLEYGFRPKPFTLFSERYPFGTLRLHIPPSLGGTQGIVGKKAGGLADARHISLQRKTTMQPHDRQDGISQFLLPQDVDKNLVPVMCKGDGNCFPRAISHLCFSTKCKHREICCRMVRDAVKNISNHLNNEKLYTGAID